MGSTRRIKCFFAAILAGIVIVPGTVLAHSAQMAPIEMGRCAENYLRCGDSGVLERCYNFDGGWWHPREDPLTGARNPDQHFPCRNAVRNRAEEAGDCRPGTKRCSPAGISQECRTSQNQSKFASYWEDNRGEQCSPSSKPDSSKGEKQGRQRTDGKGSTSSGAGRSSLSEHKQNSAAKGSSSELKGGKNQRGKDAADEAIPSDISKCIRLASKPDGVFLQNTCGKTVEVSYCVVNPKSWYPCGKSGGLVTIHAGKTYPVSDYRNSGGGRVAWAVCPKGKYPTGWKGPDGQYGCK